MVNYLGSFARGKLMTRILKPKKPGKSWKQRLAAQKSRRRKVHARMDKRVKEIYQIYKRTGSLAKTGKVLSLTRERVRQLLDNGHRTKVIVYIGVDTRRVIALFKKTDRFELIRDLAAQPQAEFCSKYGVSKALFHKLQECAASGWNLAEV